jgi:RNA polymerase sigma factor (sigma-70 family)
MYALPAPLSEGAAMTLPRPDAGRPCTRSQAPPAELVLAARRGDPAAWEQLVARFDRMLRRVAAGYRLNTADSDDAVQLTWIRFYTRGHALREPAALPTWLATTMRRECMRILQRGVDEILTDDETTFERTGAGDPLDEILADEQQRCLASAIEALPQRHRAIMELLLREPGIAYGEVETRLGVPVGSIGPIRGRCLNRLARDRGLTALVASGG